MRLKQFSLSILTCCLTIVAGTKAAEAAQLTVIADELNQPRGLSFDSDGNLYVGETGLGGDGNCQGSPSTQGELICAGDTASVTVISPDGEQSRIFEGFDSLALQPSQEQGAGPQELNFDSSGNAYLLTGYAGFPGNRDPELNTLSRGIEIPAEQGAFAPVPADRLLNTPSLGQLYKADLNTGELTSIFDFAEYELLNNPDGGDIVSNPYDFTISGDTAYVADGGGNAIYNVKLDGSEVKVTPTPRQTVDNPEYPPAPPGQEPFRLPGQTAEQAEIQSVPTGIEVGPDGAVYVGEQSGYPYPEGGARILRIGADGKPEVYADGFTQITDIKFDENGNLLVLQLADVSQVFEESGSVKDLPGSLVQLAPDGTRTTLVAAGEGLLSATGITIGPDNAIYVTNRGVGTGIGEVVRIDDTEAVPEPSSILGLLTFGALGGTTWLRRKHKLAS